MGHIAVLSNPRAGKGRGGRVTDTAVAQLQRRGARVRLYSGDSAAATAALATTALAEGPDGLVVIGGDGTLSGILDVLCAATVPITLVPAGTGNDLARALDLPRRDAAAAAELALTGTPRSIDVGEVETPSGRAPFLTVVALGFDARVSDRTNRLRWPSGALRYYLALLIELVRLRPFDFTVTIDDGAPTTAPGTIVAVGNTASYGGGMPVCVGALPDDGRLDVVRVASLGRARLVRLFPLLLRGTHLTRPEVRHASARRVTVAAPGIVVYADGERLGEDTCTVSLRAGALTVMTRPKTGDVRVR